MIGVQTFTAEALIGRNKAAVSFLWDPEHAPCQIDVSISCHALGVTAQFAITADAPSIFLATERQPWPAKPGAWQLVNVTGTDHVVLMWRDGAMFWAVKFNVAALRDLALAVQEDHTVATQALARALDRLEQVSEGWTL